MQTQAQDTIVIALDTLGSDSLGLAFVDSLAVQQDSLELVPDVAIIPPPQPSLFEGHLLKSSDSTQPITRTEGQNGPLLIIVMACLVLLAYVQRNSGSFFGSLFRSAFDMNISLQESRVENSQKLRNNLLVLVMSFLSVALFISIAINMILRPEDPLIQTFLITALVLFVAYWSKRLILILIGIIFQSSSIIKLHRHSLNLFFSINGLLLLPVSILLLYSHEIAPNILILLGSAIMAFFYLKGIQRGFLMSVGTAGINLIHLFYYLCALEILPAFVLIRLGSTF